MGEQDKIRNVTLEEREVLLEEWTERWEKGNIPFHRPDVNHVLTKHMDRLVKGRTNIRILLPMCGKTVDMKWLADQGHTVVGIEFCELAIREFFDEQKLEFTRETVANFDGEIFKERMVNSKDNRIRIYCGDIFGFNKDCEAEFDGIWERGGFGSINRKDRQKYSKILMSLMAKDCVYLMHVLQYDRSKHSGPPHSTTLEEVKEQYGVNCTVQEIDSFVAPGCGIDSLTEKVMLLKLK